MDIALKLRKYPHEDWVDVMRPSRPRFARHLRMTTILNAILGLRHGEERPGEAGLRLEPRTAPMQRSSSPASALDGKGGTYARLVPRLEIIWGACHSAFMARVRISIVFDSGARIGPGKAKLLESIRNTGSISAAAREMGMSYKRAWVLLDSIN